jgi:hypothetical protein
MGLPVLIGTPQQPYLLYIDEAFGQMRTTESRK